MSDSALCQPEMVKSGRQWVVFRHGFSETFKTKRAALDRLARIKAARARIKAERGQA